MFHDDMIYNIAASISGVHTFILLHYAQLILPQHYLNDNVNVVKKIRTIFLKYVIKHCNEAFIHHMKMCSAIISIMFCYNMINDVAATISRSTLP